MYELMKNNNTNFFFRRLPHFISVVFHPLVIPTYGILLLLYTVVPYSLMSDKGKYVIITLVASCTLIIPVAFLPLLFYRKLHNFLVHNDRQERILPLLITSVSYYIAFYLLRKIGAPFLFQIFIFASALSVVFVLIISMFWKISAHTVGIGGLTALITILLLFYRTDVMLYMMLSIILCGIIGYSRLSLNAHSPAQVYSGYLIGFFVTYGSFLIL
jgi:membrane-associated phospholipid phosphatase